MTSEQKVIALFKEVSLDCSFKNRAMFDERYLYNLFMQEAVRHSLERIWQIDKDSN